MSEAFDPYRDWLGRTSTNRPLDHYQLLDLARGESDPQAIETAHMLALARILRHERGPHADAAHRLMDEIEHAHATLSDAVKKAAYDAHLAAHSPPASPNYYRLLELPYFETSIERIETAQMIQMAKVLREVRGPDERAALQRRSALEDALATLTDTVRKAAYDAELRRQSGMEVPTNLLPIAPRSFLTLPDEEDDDLLIAPRGTAVEAEHARGDHPYAAGESSTARGEDADVGLLPPPIAAKTPHRSPPRPKASKQPIASRKHTVHRKAAPRRLPELPVGQILKVGGGVALATVLVWGAMTLLAGGPPTGQPSGRILLNGQPVVGSDMRFVSTDDPEQVFIGISGAEGQYQVSYRTLNGLPVGRYQVTITRYEMPGGKSFDGDEDAEALKSDAKPVACTFEREIARGSNAIDFELAEGRKP